VAVGESAALASLRIGEFGRAERRLFATDPRRPRRRPARAVLQGAVEADEVFDDLARFRINDERSRTAARFRIVGSQCVAEDYAILRDAVVDLVVANEAQLAVDVERGHAVMPARRQMPVGHLRAGLADGGVFETFGQRQQSFVGVARFGWAQGAITDFIVEAFHGRRSERLHCQAGGEWCGGEKRAAIHVVHSKSSWEREHPCSHGVVGILPTIETSTSASRDVSHHEAMTVILIAQPTQRQIIKTDFFSSRGDLRFI